MSEPRIALVHDELIRRGGAERVLEELARIYPSADVYALYAGNTPQMTVDGKVYPIHTSFLQSFPLWFRRHPGRVLPFLIQAAEQFDFSDYDLVISSSSGFAKAIVTRAHIPHVCYCHTPTRYLWETAQKVGERRAFGTRTAFRLMQHLGRMSDFAAAQRPDAYIANSEYTRERIQKYYRRQSTVVYPPIDTTFFTPHQNERQGYFLVVGRLTQTKHIEHAIAVCEKLHLPLVIAGTGQERRKLERLAGRFTTFAGAVSPEELRSLYRGARALLQPGVEDFGMATAEALACGTPVIAYGAGGVREIVSSSKFGVLYSAAHPEVLAESIRQFMEREGDFAPELLQRHTLKFSVARFREGIKSQVDLALARRNNEGRIEG